MATGEHELVAVSDLGDERSELPEDLGDLLPARVPILFLVPVLHGSLLGYLYV